MEKYTCGCDLLPYKSCPLHGGERVFSTSDWAIEAADRILDLDAIEMKVEGWNKDATRKRIASIIAAHAAPLVALLRESKRGHHHDEGGDNFRCCELCTCNDVRLNERCQLVENTKKRPCTCGADAWNTRVEAALK